MKVLKILYIVNCVILAVYSLAIIGLSGQIVLKNPEHQFGIANFVIMSLLAILSYLSFFKSRESPRVLITLLSISVLFEITIITKTLSIRSSGDFDSGLVLVWLSLVIALSILFIIQQWKRMALLKS